MMRTVVNNAKKRMSIKNDYDSFEMEIYRLAERYDLVYYFSLGRDTEQTPILNIHMYDRMDFSQKIKNKQ